MINNQNKPTIFGISIGKSFSDCFVEGFIKRFSGYEQQYISNITLYVNTNKMSGKLYSFPVLLKISLRLRLFRRS